MRKLIVGLALLFSLSTVAFAEYPPGAFAHFAKYPEGGVTNGLFSAYVERGVKLEAWPETPAFAGVLA